MFFFFCMIAFARGWFSPWTSFVHSFKSELCNTVAVSEMSNFANQESRFSITICQKNRVLM